MKAQLVKNSLAALLLLTGGPLFADNKFEISGSARVRTEGSDNSTDFNDKIYDRSRFTGSRFRLNFSFQADENTSVFFQPQFSKVWGAQDATPADTSGALNDTELEIHQAYIQHSLDEKLSVKLGRGELDYGDSLVLGSVDWSNVGRAFDFAGFRYKYELGWLDLFQGTTREGGAGTADNVLTGIYNSVAFENYVSALDVYYLVDETASQTPDAKTTAYGVRLKGAYQQLDYRAEYTQEKVDDPANSVADESAQQTDVEVGYRFGTHRLAAEYFMASEFYDQLYPTGHKFLGYMDLLSRRNIAGYRVGWSNTFDKLTAAVDYHVFQRDDSSAPAYKFSGAAWGTAPYAAGDDIGSEIDLTLKYATSEVTQLTFGYSQFAAGDYFKNELGFDDGADFYYLQLATKF